MLALSRSFLVVPILAACAIADSHPAGSHWSRDTPSTLTASGLPGGWKLGAACVSDVAAPNRLLSWNDNPANMTISSCLDEYVFRFLNSTLRYFWLPWPPTLSAYGTDP